MQTIAILYQAKFPPIKDGIQKPMKPGGYSDSGADIAYELKKNGIPIVTPIKNPDIKNDKDWVFPDTQEGIQDALKKGANIFWLNTILYKGHVVEKFFDLDIKFIGQTPSLVNLYDDKFYTNELLRKNRIPIPKAQMLKKENIDNYILNVDFPLVLKPIRGRASQGVSLVKNKKELDDKLKIVFSKNKYGNALYLEQYLSGQEITITVMQPGIYDTENQQKELLKPWSLPAVKRYNHENGIAPYKGIVAVMENSSVPENNELCSPSILETYQKCELAAELLDIKAPIRIDCRSDDKGNYFLFDLNMKPNMIGPARPHRKNQDSLTLLASRKIGWDYFDLLKNMVNQSWKTSSISNLTFHN